MSRLHTKVSPSYLATAIPCPAGVTLAPDNGPGSAAARAGTARHTLTEMIVDGIDVPKEIYVEGETFVVDEDMLEDVRPCVEFAQIMQDTCDTFALEEPVSLDWYYAPALPPVPFKGHVDGWAYLARRDELIIWDNKFGRKIIHPLSPQNMAYAAMLLGKFQSNFPKTIRLVILQPTNPDGAVQHATITVTELLQWMAAVLDPALKRIGAGDTAENPGEEQCLFCRRAGECRARQNHALEVAQAAFDDVPAPSSALTNDEIGYVLDNIERVETWLRQVRAEASGRIERGEDIPGWKLVEKRANRKWADMPAVSNKLAHDDFRDLLPDDVFTPRELRSPAQIEKACKKNGLDFSKLAPFITRESSGTTLVPASDKREAVIGVPALDLLTD